MADKPLIFTPSQDDIDRLNGYRVGPDLWASKYKNYCCLECQYATIFKEKIVKHVSEGNHPWGFPSGHVETEEDNSEPTYG